MYNNYFINKTNRLVTYQSDPIYSDITLIGAGIMSVTLGMFLTILEPTWKIVMYERLKKPAQESSHIWNNSGTGHAAFCELNYTTDHKNGFVDISKAIALNKSFELSRQFWAYLVQTKILKNPKSFINPIPHISFVWGNSNIQFLKRRFHALKKNILFHNMIYSEDPQKIHEWIPLLVKGRNKFQKIAATYVKHGTDINFGEITTQIFLELQKHPNFKTYLEHDVTKVKLHQNKNWKLNIIDLHHKQKKYIYSNYVFIGGGGKSLNLLQTSKIKEIIGYAGFPIGGQFLITKNPEIVAQHSAKVYGKTSINEPPMSVPHIDTRILHGNKTLLFGPFATFNSKFLKHGTWTDLFRSLTIHNIIPMLQVGIDNLELIKYLINQLIMSHTDRINTLKTYYPTANPTDWTLLQAGQRVQIIKKNSQKKGRGTLEFGTEIISSHNGTLSALLGASPGASTVVSIILKLLNNMFTKKMNSEQWKNTIKRMIPSYFNNYDNNGTSIDTTNIQTDKTLELTK